MKENERHSMHTVMQRVDAYLYSRFRMLVLLGSRTLRKWVTTEKKSFESPLEKRKQRHREETFMRRVEVYLYI